MKSAFRKLSRIRTLSGSTTWYLSDDCLLNAKRMMYSVEYRRFYLRDLESVMVWPSRFWYLRVIFPAILLGGLGVLFWRWVEPTFGYILGGAGLAWALLELALGPKAQSRIRITGATVDLPLVMRTRRAAKVLGKIDAAIRASRAITQQLPTYDTVAQPAEPSISARSEGPQAASSIAASQTNAS